MKPDISTDTTPVIAHKVFGLPPSSSSSEPSLHEHATPRPPRAPLPVYMQGWLEEADDSEIAAFLPAGAAPPPDLLGGHAYSVRDIMRVLDLNAPELATVTGRTERTVWRWLAGRNRPKGAARRRLTQLARIAWYLDVGLGRDASRWLRAPNEALRGQAPLDLLLLDRAWMVAEFLKSAAPTITLPREAFQVPTGPKRRRQRARNRRGADPFHGNATSDW